MKRILFLLCFLLLIETLNASPERRGPIVTSLNQYVCFYDSNSSVLVFWQNRAEVFPQIDPYTGSASIFASSQVYTGLFTDLTGNQLGQVTGVSVRGKANVFLSLLWKNSDGSVYKSSVYAFNYCSSEGYTTAVTATGAAGTGIQPSLSVLPRNADLRKCSTNLPKPSGIQIVDGIPSNIQLNCQDSKRGPDLTLPTNLCFTHQGKSFTFWSAPSISKNQFYLGQVNSSGSVSTLYGIAKLSRDQYFLAADDGTVFAISQKASTFKEVWRFRDQVSSNTGYPAVPLAENITRVLIQFCSGTPSLGPTTAAPTTAPTTRSPTVSPTQVPSPAPTRATTSAPTTAPSTTPTAVPTAVPTAAPTPSPTPSPGPAGTLHFSVLNIGYYSGSRNDSIYPSIPASNARVSLIGTDGNIIYSIFTDSNGNAFFSSVPVAVYSVRVESTGYITHVIQNLAVALNVVSSYSTTLVPVNLSGTTITLNWNSDVEDLDLIIFADFNTNVYNDGAVYWGQPNKTAAEPYAMSLGRIDNGIGGEAINIISFSNATVQVVGYSPNSESLGDGNAIIQVFNATSKIAQFQVGTDYPTDTNPGAWFPFSFQNFGNIVVTNSSSLYETTENGVDCLYPYCPYFP